MSKPIGYNIFCKIDGDDVHFKTVESLHDAERIIEAVNSVSVYEPELGEEHVIEPIFADNDIDEYVERLHSKNLYVMAMICKDGANEHYVSVRRTFSFQSLGLMRDISDLPIVKFSDSECSINICTVYFVADINKLPSNRFEILKYIKNRVDELTDGSFNINRIYDNGFSYSGYIV